MACLALGITCKAKLSNNSANRLAQAVPRACSLQGSNGEGSLVLFRGSWMPPQRFEEECGRKGNVWRRNIK
jgi:hypothetical protein